MDEEQLTFILSNVRVSRYVRLGGSHVCESLHTWLLFCPPQAGKRIMCTLANSGTTDFESTFIKNGGMEWIRTQIIIWRKKKSAS